MTNIDWNEPVEAATSTVKGWPECMTVPSAGAVIFRVGWSSWAKALTGHDKTIARIAVPRIGLRFLRIEVSLWSRYLLL
jgi:hypothetical protein